MMAPAAVVVTTSGGAPGGAPVAAGLTTSRAAAVDLPLRYMLTGAVFAVVAFGTAALNGQAFLDGVFLTPPLLAITHLAALGWLTMVAMGALYQFVPVVLDVAIYSERLGKANYYLYLAGAGGLALVMVTGRLQAVIWPAILAVTAVAIFLYNMARTLARVKRWPLTGWYILAALTCLALVITAGLSLAANLVLGFLPLSQLALVEAHAHLAALGWLGLLVVGVSYKLTPMFALTHPFDEWRLGRPVFVLLTAGVAGLFAGLLWQGTGWLTSAAAALAACGTGLYAWDYATMLRRRRRRPLDLTQRHNIAGVCCLVLTVVAGLALLTTPEGDPLHVRLRLAYVVLALGGWIGLTTLGQLYKIVPFLVWTHRYAPRMGRERVPLLKDLYPARPAEMGLWLLLTGLAGALAGILAGWLPLLQTGFGLATAGTAVTAANLFRVIVR